uniref:Uncharacterized protein n=1 Tax=Setaria italica TaxID=4555 RepID=K3ZYJ6_SETIT
MTSTKETELSKVTHKIIILSTNQLTFPLYTYMRDSMEKLTADSMFASLFCRLPDEHREPYVFNPKKFDQTKFYLLFPVNRGSSST